MVEQKQNVKQKNVRTLIGKVISDKMQKTIVVSVEKTSTHSCLKKVVRSSKNYKVHDDLQQARPGDIVKIREGRPQSKTKYMYLAEVVRPFLADRLNTADLKEVEL